MQCFNNVLHGKGLGNQKNPIAFEDLIPYHKPIYWGSISPACLPACAILCQGCRINLNLTYRDANESEHFIVDNSKTVDFIKIYVIFEFNNVHLHLNGYIREFFWETERWAWTAITLLRFWVLSPLCQAKQSSINSY